MSGELDSFEKQYGYFKNVHNKTTFNSEEWLSELLRNKQGKDDVKAEQFRVLGNDRFSKKDYTGCYYYYTKSLCYANTGSVCYGLALANRSALLYELRDYENCLKDIELCLLTEYPKKLHPKVLLRRCCCYHQIGKENALVAEQIKFALELIDNCKEISEKEKDAYRQKFSNIQSMKVMKILPRMNSGFKIPPVKGRENEHFAFASSSVEIQHNEKLGRHVVAAEPSQCGDVLFVEKAFFFTPLFTPETKELGIDNCHNCLKTIRSSIPCPNCTLHLYCNEKCLQNSWLSVHKWECAGMQANVWYELGVTYPAFRAVCKGLPSNFKTAEICYDTPIKFGSKQDNYPYFNSLISHTSSMEYLDVMATFASRAVTYLKQCTTFFDDLASASNREKSVDAEYFIGGLLLRHMCQVKCNGSLIDHWYDGDELTDSACFIATGMFPSISIMSHSCKPNISVFYVQDTAVVKALDTIDKGDEIVNCYGIDYRYTEKKKRQDWCRNFFQFTCNCVICRDPKNEFNLSDGFLCPYCGVKFQRGELSKNCKTCKKLLTDFTKFENKAYDNLEDDDLGNILESEKIGRKIFNKNHSFFTKLYEAFYRYYIKHGNLEKSLQYIRLFLENESVRMGKHSRRTALKIYELIKQINSRADFISDRKTLQKEIDALKEECISTLMLYYPVTREVLHHRLN